MMCSHPSNAATMSRWLESSLTAPATAVVEEAASGAVPLTGEGRGSGSRHMMHCSGSDMAPASIKQEAE